MEFRLVVDNPSNSTSDPWIHLNGKKWCLTQPLPINLDGKAPKYTCISYVWGTGREPNPFHADELMSSNTLSALSAAIRHSTDSAFWIDALCVPRLPSAKLATLGSMGYIYSAASKVIISLPSSQFPVLKQMEEGDRLPDSVLLHLENDGWARSVWTYQEVVNSKEVYFVSGSAIVDGSHFLNCLGYSLERFKASHHLSDFDVAEKLPGLHALGEVMAEYMTCCYGEISALRAMSQHRYRYHTDPKNYFYASVGAIVKGPWPWNMDLSIEELGEEFMQVCEAKNDYSFIYSSNPRSQDDPKGRTWRPTPGLLQPILAWHSYGSGQRGRYDAEGFRLENMVELTPSARLEDVGKTFLAQWLTRRGFHLAADDDAQIAKLILEDLKKMIYTGSDQYFFTAAGIFYPQNAIAENASVEIFVAADVVWVFGAAGLAKVAKGTRFEYVPGVFAGKVLKDGARDVLLSCA